VGVAQVLAQQNTTPAEGCPVHHLQRLPQADLVRRQHGLSQITLQLPHARIVGFRPVHTAPNIQGSLWIEEADPHCCSGWHAGTRRALEPS
jgi:hypothetical protein